MELEANRSLDGNLVEMAGFIIHNGKKRPSKRRGTCS